MVGFDDMALYVCQGEDNTFYASHRFDGSKDPAGIAGSGNTAAGSTGSGRSYRKCDS